ncbi:MAG: cytochrome P450 [Burkholderiales bacterium]
MQDCAIDDAIASSKTYGDLEAQHALFRQLREQDPVHWTEPSGFRPFWTVARHADILEIERLPDRFLNAPRTKLFSIEFEQSLREAMTGRTDLVRAVSQMDGDEHKAYRQITQAWFQPRQVRLLEERIAALARRSVDEMAALGPECDFYNQVAVWYPLRVIMMILGLPEADEATLLRITQTYFGGTDPDLQRGSDMIRAAQEYIAYFEHVAEQRRRQPTDDVASVIAHAQVNGQPLGRLESSSYYIALASAGHDTTSATAAGGVLALMQHPAQWRKLKDDPSLVPAAVDEMIRWVTPVKHFMRTATEDYVLHGKTIRAGDSLLLSFPSANRDPEAFDAPDEFRVDRSPNRHLGFGSGPHVCLGMVIAKLELQLLLKELLARVGSFEPNGEPAWVQTAFVGGLKRLPVRVTMARWPLPA